MGRLHSTLEGSDSALPAGTGAAAMGKEQLAWVLPAVTYEILEFKKTLREEPPVPFPAPEPYTPIKQRIILPQDWRKRP